MNTSQEPGRPATNLGLRPNLQTISVQDLNIPSLSALHLAAEHFEGKLLAELRADHWSTEGIATARKASLLAGLAFVRCFKAPGPEAPATKPGALEAAPRYPSILVRLSDERQHPRSLFGAVHWALTQEPGVTRDIRDQLRAECQGVHEVPAMMEVLRRWVKVA